MSFTYLRYIALQYAQYNYYQLRGQRMITALKCLRHFIVRRNENLQTIKQKMTNTRERNTQHTWFSAGVKVTIFLLVLSFLEFNRIVISLNMHIYIFEMSKKKKQAMNQTSKINCLQQGYKINASQKEPADKSKSTGAVGTNRDSAW